MSTTRRGRRWESSARNAELAGASAAPDGEIEGPGGASAAPAGASVAIFWLSSLRTGQEAVELVPVIERVVNRHGRR